MSFKLSNIILDKINNLIENQVEIVSEAATLDPSIPTTKCVATSNFDLTLPNGKIGQQKIITTVGGNGNITVHFNSGLRNTAPNSVTLYDEGDMIVLWASINGWHYQSYIYD